MIAIELGGGHQVLARQTADFGSFTHERLVSEEFRETRHKLWNEILDIHADQVFSIGIVTATLVAVVISNKLHNVPAEGISSFDPYGYFGVYEMDMSFGWTTISRVMVTGAR